MPRKAKVNKEKHKGAIIVSRGMEDSKTVMLPMEQRVPAIPSIESLPGYSQWLEETGGNDNNKKYDPENTPRMAFVACRDHGMTDKELALLFGVNPRLIDYWKKHRLRFYEAIIRGREEYDALVMEDVSLRHLAQGYDYEEIEVTTCEFDAEDAEGKKVKVPGKKIRKWTKHMPPDYRALNLWLCNRNSKKWKDPKYVDLQGEIVQTLDVNDKHRIAMRLTNMSQEEFFNVFSKMKNLESKVLDDIGPSIE
jgi:uncharacterized protein YhfF